MSNDERKFFVRSSARGSTVDEDHVCVRAHPSFELLLVRQAADVFGFSLSSESDFTCNLLWNDTLISMDIVSALKPYQKVNHFPTMSEISRKDLLAKNFDK